MEESEQRQPASQLFGGVLPDKRVTQSSQKVVDFNAKVITLLCSRSGHCNAVVPVPPLHKLVVGNTVSPLRSYAANNECTES